MVLESLRSLVGGREEFVLYECRNCGASLDGPDGTCSECGSEEVASFLL